MAKKSYTRTRGSRSFKSWNWNKTGRDFELELTGEGEKVNKQALQVLYMAQDDFIKSLPAEEAPEMPFITGNLHDSIVSVISYKGRVMRAHQPDPVATTTQTLDYGRSRTTLRGTKGFGRKSIKGSVYARNAVRNMQGKYSARLAATMMVTVPYAENPNQLSSKNRWGKHNGYLDMLAEKYYNHIRRGFQLYKAYSKYGRKTFNWVESSVIKK